MKIRSTDLSGEWCYGSKIHVKCKRHNSCKISARKKCLIISSFDLSKFFDKESLGDCMDTLSRKAKIDDKCYRVWFKLNEDTKISVNTSVGKSKSKSVNTRFKANDRVIDNKEAVANKFNDIFVNITPAMTTGFYLMRSCLLLTVFECLSQMPPNRGCGLVNRRRPYTTKLLQLDENATHKVIKEEFLIICLSL